MVQSVLRGYIGQGELRSLNMVQSVVRWYIGQCELRSLNMVQRVIRRYIGPPEDALHHILNFLDHIAQCFT
jgi:hypothetical protein